MRRPIELWILDDAGEEVVCPECDLDVRVPLLNKCLDINKKKKWTSRVAMKCPYCKQIIAFEVSWIPEYVKSP